MVILATEDCPRNVAWLRLGLGLLPLALGLDPLSLDSTYFSPRVPGHMNVSLPQSLVIVHDLLSQLTRLEDFKFHCVNPSEVKRHIFTGLDN